ncbi:uncharacterized protein LOC132949345 [Metopolophium dirhodum]|uniref:uncharacterized protein LOC132949345 n=1 Tax=Metopolophium dirhodum TaxID=44670 RepID=UPI0029907744|nr:uncharacterized protein LOC132949345 [Metopolophium dirhodum]
MQIMNSRHERFGSSFIDMDFKMEVRKGYSSTFHFECKMGGMTSCISTENENENPYLPINQAIINGSVAIGIGHTQLNQLSASIEVPSISSTAYLKHFSNISDIIQDTAIEEMAKAGDEERKIALENGNVDKDGVGTYVYSNRRRAVVKTVL